MKFSQGILTEKKQNDSLLTSGLRSAEQPSFFISDTFQMSALKSDAYQEPIIVDQVQRQLLKKTLYTLDLNVD